MKFHISHLASEATTADGASLERGGFIDLSKKQTEDPYNARLIAEGQLIPVTEAAERAAAAAEKQLDKEGGTS